MKWLFGSSVLILCGVSALAVEPVPASPFLVGVCTHFGQGKGVLAANLSLIRQAGIASIRDEVLWNGIEKEKGRLQMPAAWDTFVRQAEAAGIEPMLILDYGNRFYDGGDKPVSDAATDAFVRYAEFVVRHFRGVVRHYEIWNEYDISIGSKTPGSAENYAKLLKKVYPRIKAIDPSIVVYGGAMTPTGVKNGWLEKMLEQGALSYLDVVSIHTYNYGEPGRARTPEAWSEWMERVQDLLKKYNQGKPVPLYVTEMGWPTHIGKRGTPLRISGDFLTRMYLLSRTQPFLKGIWWYDFQDDGWKATYNEDNFGIVRPDLTPKPAYFSLAGIAGLVAQAEYTGRTDTGDPEVYVLRFREKSGRDVWAVWSAHEEDEWQVTLKAEGANPQPLRLGEVGGPVIERPWGARSWTENPEAPARGGEIEIVVRGTPWLVTGNLAGVTVNGVTRRAAR